MTCQNMTMAQFAEKLQNMAGGYIHSAVLDSTGLEGGWDFTLAFSGAGAVNGAGGGRGGRGGRGGDAGAPAPSDGQGEAASEPSGALLFSTRLRRSSGLS